MNDLPEDTSHVELKPEPQLAPEPASVQSPQKHKPPHRPNAVPATTTDKPKDEFASFQEFIAKAYKEGTTLTKNLIDFLNKYVVDLDPEKSKNMKSMDGAHYQINLFKMIQNVVDNSTPEDFRRNWIVILSFFWNYKKKALGDKYINRFAENWQPNDPRLIAYQRIINLIILTSDPKNRTNIVRQVNLQKTLELSFSEAGRQRILQFYQA